MLRVTPRRWALLRLGWGPALLWLSVAALIILVGRSTTQEGA